MGFQEEKFEDNSSVLETKNIKTIFKGWTFNLLLSCFIVCLSSFQFGFNIGSLNQVTPFVQDFYEFNYFKIYAEKIKEFEAGELKLTTGFKTYYDKLKLFEQKQKEFNDAQKRKNNYFNIMFGSNKTAIKEEKEYVENKRKEIKKKFNMTVEEFMKYAEKELKKNQILLKEGKEKLDNGTKLLEDNRPRYNYGKRLLELIKNLLWGLTNSLFVIGGMAGAFASKYILDYFGRKNGIIFHYIFSLMGSLCVFFPYYLSGNKFAPIFVKLGRFFFGIQGGLSCSLIPTYLSEISPLELRGQIGVIHQLFLTFGIFFSQILGFREILGSKELWHVALSFPIIPTVIGALLLIFFNKETPRFLLLERKNEYSAISALRKLRNSNNVTEEIAELYVEGSKNEIDKPIGILELFKTKDLRLPILAGIILQLTQQLSGINVVFFYSRIIFENAGFSSNIQYAILLTGLINFFCTLICIPLIEKYGRKPLLVYPIIAMIVTLVLLTTFMLLSKKSQIFSLLSVICLLIFIVNYAIGLGPIPFIFVAESFRQNARSSAMAICIFTNWLSAFFLVLLFPILIGIFKAYVFIVFSVVLVFSLVFILLKVPETKFKNSEEIIASFNKQKFEFIELQKEVKV